MAVALRVVWCAVALVLAAVLVWLLRGLTHQWVLSEFQHAVALVGGAPVLHFASPADAEPRAVLMLALPLAAPVLFYQLWFIVGAEPGAANRLRALLGGVACGFVCGLAVWGGVHLALPYSMSFTAELSAGVAIAPTYMMGDLYTFVSRLTLLVVSIVAVPVFLLSAVLCRVVDSRNLVRRLPWYLLGALIVAWLATPPDIMSTIMVLTLLALVYLLPLSVAWVMKRVAGSADSEASA